MSIFRMVVVGIVFQFLYLASVCADFPKHLEDEVTGFSGWAEAQAGRMQAPRFQSSSADPDTGHQVWRLGGDSNEMGAVVTHPDGNGTISILQAQHFYSRTSPVNRSETHSLSGGGRSGNKHYAALWDLSSKRLVAWVPGSEKQLHFQQRQLLWDKQHDNVYWLTEENRLFRVAIDFATYQTQKRLWDVFDNYRYISFGLGEGNFSDDGKRVVIAGESRHDGMLYFTPYEVMTREKHPWRQISFGDSGDVDWAGTDPTGEFIVFNRFSPKTQTLAVPFDQAASASPTVVYDHAKHSDFVVDRSGVPWIVYGNWQGLFASRLSDGSDKKVWPIDNLGSTQNITASGHVARVAGSPGLVLVSRNLDGGLYYMNIDRPAESIYLGNTRHGRRPGEADQQQDQKWGVNEHGETTVYKREPRGAVSPSGRYIFFVSDYHYYFHNGRGYAPEPELNRAYLNMIDLNQ